MTGAALVLVTDAWFGLDGIDTSMKNMLRKSSIYSGTGWKPEEPEPTCSNRVDKAIGRVIKIWAGGWAIRHGRSFGSTRFARFILATECLLFRMKQQKQETGKILLAFFSLWIVFMRRCKKMLISVDAQVNSKHFSIY